MLLQKNKQELSLTSVFLVNIVSTWFQEIVTHALTLEEPTAPVQHGGEVGGDEVSEGYRGLCQGEQETVHARRSVSWQYGQQVLERELKTFSKHKTRW